MSVVICNIFSFFAEITQTVTLLILLSLRTSFGLYCVPDGCVAPTRGSPMVMSLLHNACTAGNRWSSKFVKCFILMTDVMPDGIIFCIIFFFFEISDTFNRKIQIPKWLNYDTVRLHRTLINLYISYSPIHVIRPNSSTLQTIQLRWKMFSS